MPSTPGRSAIRWRNLVAGLLALTVLVALPQGVTSASAPEDNPGESIGIRLLEAPLNRYDDPRARSYIVDHLDPGATIKRRALITNTSKVARHFEVFAGAASIDNDTFNALSGRAGNELTAWISLDHGAIDLPAWESAEVLVTIEVPAIASQGERYGVVWAETSVPPNESGNVGMANRVGIRIYLDIGPGGEPPSNFEVSELTPERTKDGQPEVLATVHNTGGRAVDLSGTLSLTEGPASLVAGPFPAMVGTTLLPGHTGRVHVLLDKQLPNGPWKVRLTLHSGAIERTVTATLTFPSGADTVGQPVKPETWFESHLYLLIGLAVVLAAALILAFFVALRMVHRRRSQ